MNHPAIHVEVRLRDARWLLWKLEIDPLSDLADSMLGMGKSCVWLVARLDNYHAVLLLPGSKAALTSRSVFLTRSALVRPLGALRRF